MDLISAVFDRVLIRRALKEDQTIDIGSLAEALLFYKQADWLFNHGDLVLLVERIGIEQFLTLIERPDVTPTFVVNAAGVHSQRINLIERHSFQFIELAASANGQKLTSNEAKIARALTQANNGTSPTSVQMQRAMDVINFRRLNGGLGSHQNIGTILDAEISDQDLYSKSTRAVIEVSIPGFRMPEQWNFGLRKLDRKQYLVATNYDFAHLNSEYHKTVPPSHSSITPAYLAACIFDAYIDLNLATQYGVELVADQKTAAVVKQKITELIRRRIGSADQIHAFQELTLNNGRAVREAINSGERTFKEFLDLLDKAQKFKSWLGAAGVDAGSLTHHYASVCENSWAEKLPNKTLRFSIFTGAGFLVDTLAMPGAAAVGLAIGAFDSFVLDSILKGWSPSQFVQSALIPFVRK